MFDMSILYCEKDNKKSRREEQTRLLTIFNISFHPQSFENFSKNCGNGRWNSLMFSLEFLKKHNN